LVKKKKKKKMLGRSAALRSSCLRVRFAHTTIQTINQQLQQVNDQESLVSTLQNMKASALEPTIETYKLVREYHERAWALNGKQRQEAEDKENAVALETLMKEIQEESEKNAEKE